MRTEIGQRALKSSEKVPAPVTTVARQLYMEPSKRWENAEGRKKGGEGRNKSEGSDTAIGPFKQVRSLSVLPMPALIRNAVIGMRRSTLPRANGFAQWER